MVLVVVRLGKAQCVLETGENPVFGVIGTADEVTGPLKAVALGYISGSSQNVPLVSFRFISAHSLQERGPATGKGSPKPAAHRRAGVSSAAHRPHRVQGGKAVLFAGCVVSTLRPPYSGRWQGLGHRLSGQPGIEKPS